MMTRFWAPRFRAGFGLLLLALGAQIRLTQVCTSNHTRYEYERDHCPPCHR